MRWLQLLLPFLKKGGSAPLVSRFLVDAAGTQLLDDAGFELLER